MRIQQVLLIALALFFTREGFSQSITVTGSATFCVGGSVSLTAPGGSAYQWQQGNNPVVGAINQTYIATTSGSYWVIVTIAGVPTNSDTVVVTANPNPVPAFTSTNNICSGVAVQFTSSITNGTAPYTYSWHFGDGATSNAANPNHAFTSLGCGTTVFQDTLTVTDANGCTGRVIQPVTILQAPDVRLQDADLFTPFSNCDNSPSPANPNFTLTVNNISPSIGCITGYTLNWGDGNFETGLTSASFPRTHTYGQLGAFNLTITAMGVNGCSQSKNYVVANQTNPAGGLTTLGGTTGLCTPATIRFVIDAWYLNSPGTIYRLNFGDGNTVVLPHPLNATLLPDTITHAYTSSSCPATSYTAKLTVVNACDSTTYTASNIQIRKKPEAHFMIPLVACAGQNTCFGDSTVLGDYGPTCTNLTNYNWDFGDPSSGPGNTSASSSPCHIFATPGTYTVTLTTMNPCGGSTVMRQVCVTAPPVAAFSAGASSVCVGATVAMTNTSLVNTCGVTNYIWSIGYAAGFCGTSASISFAGGTTATSANPSIIFNNPGTYTVTLTIISPCGNTIAQQIVKVKQPPLVTLPTIPNACGQANICPSPTVTSCGETALSYQWLFDGGSSGSSTNANPGCITFNTVGLHTVSLAVTNECGTTTVSRQFTVNAIPDLSIPTSVSFCPGASTGNFAFNSLTPAALITWTNTNPAIGLAASGSGNINSFTTINSGSSPLVATIAVTAAASGCFKQLTFTITVNPTPALPGVTATVNYCKDAVATALAATPAAGNTLLWYTAATGGTGSATAPIPITSVTGTTIFYVSQVNPLTGCESGRSAITVNVYAIPSISSANAANPGACATATGSITLTGLTPAAVYTVHYFSNGIPVTTSIAVNAGGNIVIAGLASGIYTNIQVTLNGCSSDPVGPFTLTDPNPPATPEAGNSGPVCAGQVLTLSSSSSTPGVSYTWTGPNGFSSNQQNPVISPATVAASGTYHVISTLNNCQSIPGSVDVLVYPTPSVQASPNVITVCSGDTIKLRSSSGFAGTISYSWTGPNGFTSNLQNPIILNAATIMTGTYTVVVTAANGNCASLPANVSVTVHQRPSLGGSFLANPVNCGSATGSITLTGLIPSSTYIVNYQKDGSPVTVSFVANSAGNIFMGNLFAGTYSNINVSLNNCASDAVGPFTLVDPNPPTSPAVNSNGPVCEGASLAFTSASTPGATYAWTGPNGFTSSVQNPIINGVTLAASGTYTVIATLNNCHSLPASIGALINPRPVLPVVPANINACAGDTIKLISSSNFPGAISYSWTGPNGFTSTQQNPEIPNASPVMIGTYHLVVTSVQGSCASPTASSNVSVLPLPHISSSSHINPIGCGTATGSIILNGLTPSSTYTFYYSLNGGPIASVTAIANSAGAVIIGNLYAGVYTDVTVSLNGCGSNTAGPFMLRDTAPFSVVAESNGPLCENNNLVLNAQITISAGATYSWNGPNGFVSLIQSPVIPAATPSNNGVYYVAVTVAGCTSTDSISVTVSEHSIGGISGPDATVCRGKNSGSVTMAGNLGQVIRWEESINNGLSWSPVNNTTFSIGYSNLTTTTWYRVFTQNGACPSVYSNVTRIDVLNAVQSVSISPADISSCARDTTIAFTAIPIYTGTDPVSYYWYINGHMEATINPFNWIFHTDTHDSSSTIIKVLAENSFGCGDTSQVRTITINPVPLVRARKTNDITCSYAFAELRGTGASSYNWHLPGGNDSTIANPGFPVTRVRPLVTTLYELTGYSDKGCIAKDTVTVQVKKDLLNGSLPMPNAFTPNGDGLNDRIGAIDMGWTGEFKLTIFDRWGKQVYYTEDPHASWDGTVQGKRQGSGVFVYLIKGKTMCDDEMKLRKGTIVLVRLE